jgi:Tfp pilus assembly protein PilO
MPRSFKLPGNFAMPTAGSMASSIKEPQVLVRAALGLLLAANLAAAAYAFHLVGISPQALDQQLAISRSQLQTAQARLKRSRLLTANIDKGKAESEHFLATYFSNRRYTYSTIVNEINQSAKTAGMNMKEATFATLDPIEGTDDLEMLTVSINFEGGYGQLVKLVNLLDRSPRFLIIESLQVSPQAKGDIYSITTKLNAFVHDVPGGAL